jgi:hypothetical protein
MDPQPPLRSPRSWNSEYLQLSQHTGMAAHGYTGFASNPSFVHIAALRFFDLAVGCALQAAAKQANLDSI